MTELNNLVPSAVNVLSADAREGNVPKSETDRQTETESGTERERDKETETERERLHPDAAKIQVTKAQLMDSWIYIWCFTE